MARTWGGSFLTPPELATCGRAYARAIIGRAYARLHSARWKPRPQQRTRSATGHAQRKIMADARSLRRVFEEQVVTPRFSAQDAPRTAPGLRNAKPEDRKAPAAEKLNWWQASNVKLIIDFIEDTKRVSEGMVLCDAPGLGKTLSVLAAIVRSNDTNQSKNLVVVFASKGIVAQWG